MNPNRWLAGALAALGIAAAVLALPLLTGVGRPIGEARSAPQQQLGSDLGKRKVYAWALALFSILVIYASLTPLKYHALRWDRALEQFSALRFQPLGEGGRSDFVGNVLLFIPFAYLAAALLTKRRSLLWLHAAAIVAATALSAVFSVATQFPQLWFDERESSFNDIVANTIGGAIGGLLFLAVGRIVEDWTFRYLAERTTLQAEQSVATGEQGAKLRARQRQLEIHWLLGWYLVGLAIYSVLPLDVTISPVELYHRVLGPEARGVSLVPWENRDAAFVRLCKAANGIMTFIPVGMACAALLLRPGQGLRSLWVCTKMGAGIAALIEIAQLFIHSHAASPLTVVLAAGGSLAGAAIMHGLVRGPLSETRASWSGEAAQRAGYVCLALLGIYSLLLVAEFCADGGFNATDERLRNRFHTMWERPPLATLYRGSEAEAIEGIVRKLVFFAPLGALAAGAAWALGLGRPARWLLWSAACLYAAGVSFAIEMIQVYRPTPTGNSQLADVGDVVLCTAGAALGMYLMWRILAPQEKNDEARMKKE